MSGRHEPPSNRSFYLSLATSTLRFAIIVALVVSGVLLINRAFPEGGTAALPPSGGLSSTPPPTTAPPTTPPPKSSPQIEGVRIGVFNGTNVTGLAAETASTLEKKFGYIQAQLGDTPQKPLAQTTLYYRTADDKIEAQALAQNFFKGLKVVISHLPAETGVDKSVQVAIYLGTDYVASQQ